MLPLELWGGSYLAKPYIFPETETIKDRLKKDRWAILEHDRQSSEWSAIYGKYKLKTVNDATRLDSSITPNESDDTGIPKLKKSCESALSKQFSESLYKSVIRWCVAPVSVESRLEYLGNYTKINVDGNNTSDDQSIWQQRETEFQKQLATNNTYLGVNLASPSNNQADNIKKLKEGCKSHLDKKNYEDEFEISMEKVKTWCGK
ncbi:hypothetical protein MHF_1403 [Mycoplasma haemofelis Ohio2]|uniref:Uncharacterized protein n=1 Tax=Mycoplasma haemofelis (strain Ohio2) TaxID=859194 RepID=F6FGK1_MYCHI|nr:hypothetical protein MHF_1403 [Mycoplasma haemofelis Ohio2]